MTETNQNTKAGLQEAIKIIKEETAELTESHKINMGSGCPNNTEVYYLNGGITALTKIAEKLQAKIEEGSE